MGKNSIKPQPKVKLKLKRTLIIIAVTGVSLSAVGYYIFAVLGFTLWPESAQGAPLITTAGNYIVTTPEPSGPGGVGNSNSNRFWFDANSLLNANADGDGIGVWDNDGGNTINATQLTPSRQPILFTTGAHTINGEPALYFDGSNDYLKINNNSDLNVSGSWTNRTLSMVFRTGADVSTRQFLFEEGGGVRGLSMYIFGGELYFGAWNKAQTHWGFFHESKTIAPNTEYIITMAFSGTNAETGIVECYVNEELIGTMTNVGRLYAHSGDVCLGRSGSTLYETSGPGTGHYFQGEIAEFIMYNYTINSAQRIIMHNYLSSKYNIALNSNDLFQNDTPGPGSYQYEIAGIGRVDINNVQDDSRGDGIIRMQEIDNLDDDEFLIWGHDGGLTNISEVTDIPVGMMARMQRVWQVSEMNVSGSAVDVGMVDIIIDLNGLFLTAPTEIQLVIDTDDDNSFTDEVPVNGLLTNTANVFVFQHISDLTSGKRFSFGSAGGTFLPIELGDFGAELVGEEVEVDWHTKSQSNNDYFTLEHSIDGENYVEIAEIDGAGSTSQKLFYGFTHRDPVLGTNYYRLTQTDFNGDSETFEPVTVVFEKDVSELTIESVAPNPFENEFKMQYITSFGALATITITNSQGVQVFEEQVESNEGLNEFFYSEGYDLKAGMYILTVTQGSEQRASTKLIKK